MDSQNFQFKNLQLLVRSLISTRKLEIFDDFSNIIGYLELISISDIEDVALIEKFTQWRSKYKHVFYTVFEPSEARTKKWLYDQVLSNKSKIFFKILNKENALVGHVGAIGREGYIEYDNLIRGEEVGIPGFGFYVACTLMNFLFSLPGVELIYGKTLSTNTGAIRLHEKTGFIVYNKIPLRKISKDKDEFKWVEDPTNLEAKVFGVEIKLTKAEYQKVKNNQLRIFEESCMKNIFEMNKDRIINDLSLAWIFSSSKYKYSYNFKWLGRPIIQLPQDIVALQEIIWEVKPDLIIETGIAHGGSIIFTASMLELIGGDGEVVGIDIDIRSHNREKIEEHKMFKRITMFEGSSIDKAIAEKVYQIATRKKNVMVILDSNHTHEHVLEELKLYSHLVGIGNYCVICDTIVEDLPEDFFSDRPWGKGNNPKTAVWEFLKTHDEFKIDANIHNKLLITVAPDGFLKRIK